MPPLTGLRPQFTIFPSASALGYAVPPLRGSRKHTIQSFIPVAVNHWGGLGVIAVMVDADDLDLEDEIKEAVCWQY